MSRNQSVKCSNYGPCFARGGSGNCVILTSGYEEGKCPFQAENMDEYKGKKYPPRNQGFHKYD